MKKMGNKMKNNTIKCKKCKKYKKYKKYMKSKIILKLQKLKIQEIRPSRIYQHFVLVLLDRAKYKTTTF